MGLANEVMEQIQVCLDRLALPVSHPWVGRAEFVELQLKFEAKKAAMALKPMRAFLEKAKTHQWNDLYMSGLVRLGQALRWSGQHDLALRTYQEALPLAKALGNHREVTAVVYGLAALSR